MEQEGAAGGCADALGHVDVEGAAHGETGRRRERSEHVHAGRQIRTAQVVDAEATEDGDQSRGLVPTGPVEPHRGGRRLGTPRRKAGGSGPHQEQRLGVAARAQESIQDDAVRHRGRAATGGVEAQPLDAVLAFVVLRQGAGDWRMAAAWGAAFGGVAYMTYDLTNLATLRDWPLALSFIDVAWGCVATGVAATAGRLVADRVSAT